MAKPKPDPAICARIAAARIARGLTQDDLAARLGVKREAVARWESARAMPSRRRLADCAGVLDVSEGWLVTGVAASRITVPPPGAEHAE